MSARELPEDTVFCPHCLWLMPAILHQRIISDPPCRCGKRTIREYSGSQELYRRRLVEIDIENARRNK